MFERTNNDSHMTVMTEKMETRPARRFVRTRPVVQRIRFQPVCVSPFPPVNHVVARAAPGDDPLENPYADPRRGIGADYGEGFLQGNFGSSELVELDVDTMNDQLKVTGAQRHRQSQFPDEAFGLIFDLSVFVDVESKQREAWDRVADSHGYRRFDFAGRPASHVRDMMAERLILHVFKWTSDIKEARALAFDHHELLITLLSEQSELRDPSVLKWLDAVFKQKIPCAIVSIFDRKTVRNVLERLKIDVTQVAIIAAEAELESRSERFLMACMELRRPPEQSIVFCNCVESIIAAHNITAKAVAIVGDATAHQLSGADLLLGSGFDELTIYGLRRLFANQGEGFMSLKKKRSEDDDRGCKPITQATLEPPEPDV